MKPIRLGLIGGGSGAFIGAIHRIAARMDGHYQLVAGALSSDPERAASSAVELGLARSYSDFHEMAQREAALEDGIEAVSIATPNHLHADATIAFLRAGIHVICDKPLAATPEQAQQMADAVRESRVRFFLTHNYAALPMVREARALAAEGALGEIRLVHAEYLQGWLSETVDNKQAEWRTDPARAGAGALGDIGTHAWQLAQFVTGMTPDQLSADVSSIVPGRVIDDDARVAFRYPSGARGGLWVSQVAVGQENGLSLRVFGTKAALEWRLSASEELWFTPKDGPQQKLTRAQDRSASSRTPPGHPEGYLEGFANLYTDVAAIIRGDLTNLDRVPGLVAGLSGMAFIAAAQDSSRAEGAWTKVMA